MNVFVLSTGRTGSLSLEKACRHIQNYSVAHESRCSVTGPERVTFPDRHIEIDNRLSWYLGRLENAYGDKAFYVHMVRNPQATAESYRKRWNRETGIVRAFAYGIQKRQEHEIGDPGEMCMEYVTCVNENISSFLRNKSHKMVFRLEHADTDFKRFWEMIGAEGNYEAALMAFSERHNDAEDNRRAHNAPVEKLLRIVKKFPYFLKNA